MRLAAAVACLIQPFPVQSLVHEWASSSVASEHHSLVHTRANSSIAATPHSRRLGKRRGRMQPQSSGVTDKSLDSSINGNNVGDILAAHGRYSGRRPGLNQDHGVNIGMSAKDRRWGGHLAQLRGSQQLRNAPTKECDPITPLDGSSAELGILTCSLGQYCIESKESSLGGYCVEAADPIKYRQRQDKDSLPVTAFDFVYKTFCTEAYYAYPCDCTNVDRDANTLDVVCNNQICHDNYYSQCFVNLDVCVETEWTASVQGPDEIYVTGCYKFLKPYYQTLCYNKTWVDLTVDPNNYLNIDKSISECRMDFNGVTCNSCEVVPTLFGDNTYDCYHFDCTNTEGTHAGSSCYGDANPIYKVYTKTYGCVEDCNVCGELFGVTFRMAKPGKLVNVTFDRG
jgi:hypothetical protein